jgi:hypothetical protein
VRSGGLNFIFVFFVFVLLSSLFISARVRTCDLTRATRSSARVWSWVDSTSYRRAQILVMFIPQCPHSHRFFSLPPVLPPVLPPTLPLLPLFFCIIGGDGGGDTRWNSASLATSATLQRVAFVADDAYAVVDVGRDVKYAD